MNQREVEIPKNKQMTFIRDLCKKVLIKWCLKIIAQLLRFVSVNLSSQSYIDLEADQYIILMQSNLFIYSCKLSQPSLLCLSSPTVNVDLILLLACCGQQILFARNLVIDLGYIVAYGTQAEELLAFSVGSQSLSISVLT